MFPYRVKYPESEYDIQNNDLLYRIHQQCQTTFGFLENVGKFRKTQKQLLLFLAICNFGICGFGGFLKYDIVLPNYII